MPSAFFPIKLAYEDAENLGLDPQVFKAALFAKLGAGVIAAQSELGLRSSLRITKYEDAYSAAAALQLPDRIRNGIIHSLKRTGITHLHTGNGYITIEPLDGALFKLMDDDQAPALLAGPEIRSSFWDSDTYYDKSQDTIVSWDWLTYTRSTFYRVEINRKDYLASGLLGAVENPAQRPGRKNIYNNQELNEAFVSWLAGPR